MPFAIPTLGDLVERSRRSFRAYLPGTDAWLWPNNIGPTAKVIGGMTFEVFGFADYIAKQKFALTADGENLDRHGQEVGISRKTTAPAYGTVTLTAAGALTVSAGAIFQRGDGVQYRALTGSALLGAGTLDTRVVATTDGKAANAIAGTALEIVSGVTGDATAAVGGAEIIGGAEVEPDGPLYTLDVGTFRGRILFRKRNPPHGGAASDYVLWATAVSGVTRVYVERLWNGTGTVRVFVLMDDLYADGIPPPSEIARVADYIETVRPSGALVTVSAPSAVVVNITVAGLSPNTTTVREAVLAELREAFRRLSRVAGADTPHGGMPFLAVPTSFSRSWIWQAVANATGEERHSITVPSGDVALSSGQMATLGTVTFA
jgi:uncharacterized phage protein gp47/JayE